MNCCKKWYKFFLINLGVAIFSYFMTISLQLVNQYDGIWHPAFCYAGNYERGQGRWIWPYIDKLRLGLQTDPFCNVCALVIIVLTSITLLSIFDISPDDKKAYLISFLITINTSVGVWLSYRFMSITFALSFFTAVLAVYICSKPEYQRRCRYNNVLKVLCASICIVISLGTYQAFFNCVCMAFLAVFILMLYRNTEKTQLIKYFITSICSIFLGAGLYFSGLKITLCIYKIEMSDYQSGSSLSFVNTILNIPRITLKIIYYFRQYFFGILFRWNRFQEHHIFVILVFIIFAIILSYGFVHIFKKNKTYSILYLICLVLMLLATNSILYVATETFLCLQMTCGLMFFIPVCSIICLEIQRDISLDYPKKSTFLGSLGADGKICYFSTIICVMLVIIIYGNFIAVQIDQNANREGRTGTVTLAGNIVDSLMDIGYADNPLPVCFVGVPASNERFMYTEIYPAANPCMQFGNWEHTASVHGQTWVSIFREYLGYFVLPCSDEKYEEVTKRDDVRAMPLFPRTGSIVRLDDVIVVKVSDNY